MPDPKDQSLAFWQRLTRRETGVVMQFVKYGLCGGLSLLTHLIIVYSLSIWVFPA